MQIGCVLGLCWGLQTGHAEPLRPSLSRLPFKYTLPWVHRGDVDLGKVDPLWGRELPGIAERQTDEPIAVHIARIREHARQHPESRPRAATYLRVLRKLEHHVRDRAAEHARAESTPADELSFEYRLPHLQRNDLPSGLADPIHGFVKNGVVHYTHGDEMTRKAPHVYIAMLKSWAAAHPEGRATAEAYIALFEKNAARLHTVDLEQRTKDAHDDHVRQALHIETAVLAHERERAEARAGRPLPSPTPAPVVDHLARGGVSNPPMPAFKKLVDQSGALQTRPLHGYRIIGLQHLLSNTGAFIRALANAGVRPEDTAMMGKLYSQHGPVLDELRAEGFAVREARWESVMDVHYGWGGQPTGGGRNNRRVELDEMVEKIVSGQGERHDSRGSRVDRSHKYLVVDDGGELIEHIHRYYPELHDRVVAVEQTRKGIRRVQALGSLRFPVINMAEAKAKLELESPMIGRALAVSAMKRLQRVAQAGIDPGKEILLVGYGDIGARTAAALKDAGYTIAVLDANPEAEARAAAAGYKVYGAPPAGLTRLQHALSQSKIVLSTTGTTSIKPADLEHAPSGTVFMNGASSSTEIMPFAEDLMRYQNWPKQEGDDLVTTVAGKRFVLGKFQPGGDPQMDWVLRTGSGKEHIIVGRGQVINFDNGPGVLPPRYAQLIVGLLYMSSIQATQTTRPGIHPVDEARQASFVRDVQADLARTGESLEQPRF